MRKGLYCLTAILLLTGLTLPAYGRVSITQNGSTNNFAYTSIWSNYQANNRQYQANGNRQITGNIRQMVTGNYQANKIASQIRR